MLRSCERDGWSGGKLDLVWTSLWFIDDSAWFLKAWICCSRSFFLVIFGAHSWRFSWSVFGTFLLGIWWGMYAWTLRGSFPFHSPPKSVGEGARFWGFRCSRVRGVLGGISSIPLDLESFGDRNLSMDYPWGVPTIPKVLRKSVEWFGRSGVGFGGADPRVLFIPRAQATPVWPVAPTSLTGADPSWVFAQVNIWVSSLLSRVTAVSSSGQFGAR
jgi:hypothetical protein